MPATALTCKGFLAHWQTHSPSSPAAGRLASAELVEALVAIEGRPWAEWKAGKAITANGFARLLAPFASIGGGIGRQGARIARGLMHGHFFSRDISQL